MSCTVTAQLIRPVPLFSHYWFSHDAAHIIIKYRRQNEPRCEKTGLLGFRPDPTQTGLYSHRR